MALPQRAASGLAHHREDFGQHLVHRLLARILVLDRGEFGLPFGDPGAQAVVAFRRDLRLERVDRGHRGPHPLQFAVVFRTEDLMSYKRQR